MTSFEDDLLNTNLVCGSCRWSIEDKRVNVLRPVGSTKGQGELVEALLENHVQVQHHLGYLVLEDPLELIFLDNKMKFKILVRT